MDQYDKNDDTDILFDVDLTGDPVTLTVDPGNELYIWPDSVFYSHSFWGDGKGATVSVDDIKIAATGEYNVDVSGTSTYVSGSWINFGSYSNGTLSFDTVTFNAAGGTKDIVSGSNSFNNVYFNTFKMFAQSFI